MSLRSRCLALATATMLAAATMFAAPAAHAAEQSVVTDPSRDPFYQPPSPLPSGNPGTIIRSRPVDVRALGIKVPVKAWQVLYLSRSALDKPIAASGTVIVPETRWTNGKRPLVAYSIGTHGMGDRCAPSYKLRLGTENESALMAQALLKGWALAVPDYQGLGTPGSHTYVAGPSQGHTVLDAARAAQGLSEAGLGAGTPLGLWGYSQGGYSTAWAAELQPSYAPELTVKGAAPGGVPTDLEAVLRYVDGTPFSGIAMMGARGLATAYPDLPFESILNARGKLAMDFVDKNCVAEISTLYSFKKISDFTTVDDPVKLPAWQRRLGENRLPQRKPGVPVMIYHGTADELIPFAQAKHLYEGYCKAGVPVNWKPLPITEHIVGAATGAPGAVSWLDDRFSGKPAPNSCGTAS